MTTMIQREKQCLDFIRKYESENGETPTRREIADALYIGEESSVGTLLKRLEKRGHVRLRRDGTHRSIELREAAE